MLPAKPAIYPTLVIGLGGTGTNVVRHVKRRFLRTWQQDELDDLPSVLQVLSLDTEPLTNPLGNEALYHHEFGFLGKYDATRLIQNRQNHPYLAWWQWAERDIPLGYIHSGAKQLRPIGRLSLFRNYVVFKTLMVDKLHAMKENSAIQEAEERGFAVVSDNRLVYVVSSLCGGTGAGLFLDVAHRIRHEVGANAHVVGIFLMPSVFEKEIRSDLQRRRVKANAYAALKELNYFHTTQAFQALYPSEQHPLPETRYRAFNQIFLIERNDANGRALSSKAAAEQMVAHLIHLTAFSHLNKRILGLDVNVTEERASGNQKYFSYSSFGVSALVMPRAALWRYVTAMTTYWALTLLLEGTDSPDDGSPVRAYHALRDTIKKLFQTYEGSMEELQGLETDIVRREGRWLGIPELVAKQGRHVLDHWGLATLREQLIERLALEPNDAQLKSSDLSHEEQVPFRPSASAERIWFWERPFLTGAELARREKAVQDSVLAERRRGVWNRLLESVRHLAREWLDGLVRLEQDADEAATEAWERAQQAARQVHPLHGSHDSDTSTYYDLETGAIGSEHLEAYWQSASELLSQAHPDAQDGVNRWRSLQLALYERLLPDGANSLNSPGSVGLGQVIEEELHSHPSLVGLQEQLNQSFDLRSVIYLQHAQSNRPANYRVDQFYRRIGPHASVDGDTHPYSEAIQEHTRLVTTPPTRPQPSDQQDHVFQRALKGYGQFEWVQSGDGDRMDACHIVHGLPVGQLECMPELYRHYHSDEFAPRSMLHLQPEWVQLPELYTPPSHPSVRESPPDITSANGDSPQSPSSPSGSGREGRAVI